MKRSILLFLFIFTGTLYSQSNNINKTISPGKTYARDTLTAAVDTADISTASAGENFQRWTIQVYTTTGTDTLSVFTKSRDNGFWIQRSLTSMAAGTVVTTIPVTTTPTEFIIIDSEVKFVRLITASDDESTTVFIIDGKRY
jgi:hypothetical protein